MSESEQTSEEIRSAAARLLGGTPSDAKRTAAQQNASKATAARTGKPMSEEHRRNIGEASRRAWQRRKEQGNTEGA